MEDDLKDRFSQLASRLIKPRGDLTWRHCPQEAYITFVEILFWDLESIEFGARQPYRTLIG